MVTIGGRYKRGDLPILGGNQHFTGENTFESDIIFESDTNFIQGFKTDIIGEYNSASGVTVDGILLKDGNADGVDVSDHSARHENGGDDEIDLTGLSGAFDFAEGHTFTGKNTFASDVVFQSDINFESGFKTDSIGEYNSGEGVTVDSLLLKDGNCDGIDVSGIKLNSMPSVADGDITCSGQKLTNLEGIDFSSDMIFKTPVVFDELSTFNSDISFAGVTKPVRSFCLPPEGWIRPVTNGMELFQSDGVFSSCELRADWNTDEKAYKTFGVPENYSGGAITIDIDWYSTDLGTSDVVFNVSSVCVGDSDTWDASATATARKTDANDGTSQDITVTSISLTDHVWVADETVKMQLLRDADNAGDTLANDIRITMVKVKYPISS